MHICNLCNYETPHKPNIYLHNKTQKHINNKELYDKKIKDEKDNKENKEEQIKLLNNENEKLKQELLNKEKEIQLELLNKDKEIAKLETKVEIYKELSEKGKNSNNNGIIINTNTNTNNLNYVNKHFKDAPPLKKLSNYVLHGIDLTDDTQIDKLIDKVIYSYNNKCLHKLIGDHIIQNYKMDNLQMQSIHTTDISRRKYLIKLEDNLGFLYDESSEEIDNYDPEKNNNESSSESNSDYDDQNELKEPVKEIIKDIKSKWTHDNEGIKVSYLLFEPLIRQIIRQMKKKCRQYNIEMKKNLKKIPTMTEIKKYEVLYFIMKEIDNNRLKTNINNYIAPHFGLEKK